MQILPPPYKSQVNSHTLAAIHHSLKGHLVFVRHWGYGVMGWVMQLDLSLPWGRFQTSLEETRESERGEKNRGTFFVLLFHPWPSCLQPAGIDRVIALTCIQTRYAHLSCVEWHVTSSSWLLIQISLYGHSCFSLSRSSMSHPTWFLRTISHLPIFLIKVRWWTRSLMLTLIWGWWCSRLGLGVKEYGA